jgi:hypothetical protein
MKPSRFLSTLICGLCASALISGQISIPFSFSANTVASPDQVNSNFNQLGTQALNRTGGTMTGSLTTQAVLPSADAAYALGTGGARYTTGSFSGTVTANAFSGNGGAVTGLDAGNIIGGTLAVARLANGVTTPILSSTTSNQNNWAPGLAGDSVIYWSGGSNITVTGFAGGIAGQRVTFRNTGNAIAFFAHNSGSSSAGNKLFNFTTSGLTGIAAGGAATWQHDGTQWELVSHEQGAWINSGFSAGNFTGNGAMTWTLAGGDVTTFGFRLSGRTLTVAFILVTTTVGGTPNTDLQIGNAAWGSYSIGVTNQRNAAAYVTDNGTVRAALLGFSGTNLIIERTDLGNWTASTDNTAISGQVSVEVQ